MPGFAGAPNTTVMSMSDAGEPGGTAGRPILNVLIHSGLGEIVAAVVRYFGGIKLGTGGLQRAYSGAVSEALQHLSTTEKIVLQKFSLSLPYALEAKVRHSFSLFGATLESCVYQQDVLLEASVAAHDFDKLNQVLQNISGGTIQLIKPGE